MADSCPLCKADLQGSKIPWGAWGTTTQTHFSRKIGVEIHGVFDGVLFWRCPDCGGAWNRWDKEEYLHAIAEEYMAAGRE